MRCNACCNLPVAASHRSKPNNATGLSGSPQDTLVRLHVAAMRPYRLRSVRATGSTPAMPELLHRRWVRGLAGQLALQAQPCQT